MGVTYNGFAIGHSSNANHPYSQFDFKVTMSDSSDCNSQFYHSQFYHSQFWCILGGSCVRAEPSWFVLSGSGGVPFQLDSPLSECLVGGGKSSSSENSFWGWEEGGLCHHPVDYRFHLHTEGKRT